MLAPRQTLLALPIAFAAFSAAAQEVDAPPDYAQRQDTVAAEITTALNAMDNAPDRFIKPADWLVCFRGGASGFAGMNFVNDDQGRRTREMVRLDPYGRWSYERSLAPQVIATAGMAVTSVKPACTVDAFGPATGAGVVIVYERKIPEQFQPKNSNDGYSRVPPAVVFNQADADGVGAVMKTSVEEGNATYARGVALLQKASSTLWNAQKRLRLD